MTVEVDGPEGSDERREAVFDSDAALVALKKRAKNLAIGCSKRSREHEYSYEQWSRRSIYFAIAISIFGGVAGATLLASAPAGSVFAYIAGGLGVLTTILTTIDSKISTSTKAEAHRKAFAGFAAIRTEYYDLVDLEVDLEKARKTFAEINQRKLQLEKDSPPAEHKSRERREREERPRRVPRQQSLATETAAIGTGGVSAEAVRSPQDDTT